MSEFRQDPLTGRWHILAEGRSARPNEYTTARPASPADPDCPFCDGHESRTPPELAAVRPPGSAENGPGWTVRSIPNKFPTVGPGTNGVPPAGSALFRRAAGTGLHEVIIESPAHAPDLPYLSAGQLAVVFSFFRGRVREIERRPGIGSALLFENRGPESGGTLTHPHAQLVGTEAIPFRLAEEANGFRRGSRSESGGCLLESIVVAEATSGQRVVVDDGTFMVLAPFASEHPYEMWVVPHRHARSFAAANDTEVERLAELLPALLRALDHVRPNASYNWFVHGLPPASLEESDFHWHVEIAPRLVRADGFELGGATAVNPVPPERAATDLRAELAKEPGAAPRKR